MTRGIYLDNSSTTRPSDKAVSSMLSFFTERWGTPSSPHQMGQELFPAIEEALKSIYSLLGATEKDSFVFTSSGAEAVNHAILSAYFDVTRATGKNQFIASTIDEAPVLMSLNRLEQLGCVGKLVTPNSQGTIPVETIAEAISPRTALISLSWANGLTGVIQPVHEIAKLCQERGILFHLEATHVLGKHFYNLDEVGAHLISFNGDHLHAPQGSGGLYIKSGVNCSPFIVGGLEQASRRAGTMNVPALVALGSAAKEAKDCQDLMCTEVARLRDRLEEGLLQNIPDIHIFFRDQQRLPHCTIIGFPHIVNEALLYALNRKNLFASIGGGSFQQIGLILSECDVPKNLAQTALNFSLSRYTTEDEIERAITIITEAARKLKKMSLAI